MSAHDKTAELKLEKNMNRKIKFRVIHWAQDCKPYLLYPKKETASYYCVDWEGDVLEDYGSKEKQCFEQVYDNYAIAQQDTGSNDSSHQPIYEGDIVLWHTEDPFEGGYFHKKMVVGWNQRCMQFRLYEFPNQVGKVAGETFWAEDVKVIGHIFDFENEECRYHLDQSVKGLVK